MPHPTEVIAWTYNADHWCEDCLVDELKRQGVEPRLDDPDFGMEYEIGPVFGDTEWFDVGHGGCEELRCNECGKVLDTAHDWKCENPESVLFLGEVNVEEGCVENVW